MIKSKTINNFSNVIYKMSKNSKSFCDFSVLKYKGSQKILTPGEYCMKNTSTKYKRRKVIQYFYNKIY